MLENLKLSLNLFAKMLIISIFAFFAIIGVSVICNNFFSKEIGYTAFGTKEENGKSEFLYEYKNSDGEDKLKKDATKYFKITYPRNLMETIDMKVIVKNTILINGVNEQTEHFIFAKENSHLFD